MGWKIGAPSLKLNNAGVTSKHCGDFGSVAREALEEREGRDPDINRELAEQNRLEGFRTAKELQEYSEKHLAQLRDAKGRKLRKDAVVMCATILKPPAAMMATLSPERQRAFLQDANEVFAEIVGKNNVKSRADHFDELGAHSHVFWEPMTADGRLCAKEMHSLKFFGQVNRELPRKLRERGWDIEDCEMYDSSKEYQEAKNKNAGRSSTTYKAEAERKKAELEQEVAALEEKADVLWDAVRLPEELQAVQVKKTLTGDVKLSQEGFNVYRETAEGAAVAKVAANDLAAGWDQMEADAEAARRESAQLRSDFVNRQMRLADLQRQVQTLQKEIDHYRRENQSLKDQLKKMQQVARGEAGIISKLAKILPGSLGDAAFLVAMNKATGMKFDSMAAFQAYRNNAENILAMHEETSKQLLEEKKKSPSVYQL